MRGHRHRGSRRHHERDRHNSSSGGIGTIERLALSAVSLAFVAVFVMTYMYGVAGRSAAPVDRSHLNAPAETFTTGKATADATDSLGTALTGHRVLPKDMMPEPSIRGTFSICTTGASANCVVDGDTAWIGGTKVRIADIDAPETHPPRCDVEVELGGKATNRLVDLMNAGPFELKLVSPEADRYGRKLRILVRDGRSLGDQLVAEGLARTWEGQRRPWC